MFLFKWGLMLGLVAVVGCGDKSKFKAAKANSPPKNNQEEKTKEVVMTFEETAPLHIARTNERLESVKSNEVSVKGSGKNSIYKIVYKFNSGSQTSFGILETNMSSRAQNCSTPGTRIYLKNGTETRELNLVDRYPLKMDTEYEMEVQFRNRGCEDLDVTYDLLVWAGNPEENPKLGMVCSSSQVGRLTFVFNVDLIRAYSPIVGKEYFLGNDVYCGEKVKPEVSECQMSGGHPPGRGSYHSATCSTEILGERYSLEVKFDVKNKKGSLNCQRNGRTTFVDNLTGCDTRVVNYQP